MYVIHKVSRRLNVKLESCVTRGPIRRCRNYDKGKMFVLSTPDVAEETKVN